MKKTYLFIVFLIIVLTFNFFRLKTNTIEEATYSIYIHGAVNNPGKYDFNGPKTLEEIVFTAGGFTNLADLSQINLDEIYTTNSEILINKLIRVTLLIEKEEPKVLRIKEGMIVDEVLKYAKDLGVLKLEQVTLEGLNLTKVISDGESIKLKLKEAKEEVIKKDYLDIEVKGAVKKPGVYKVKYGSIARDVIDLAGGFTLSSDIDNFNQVEVLKENKVLVVGNLLKNNYHDDKLDINRASILEFSKLPRIGEALASRIVEVRKNKLFETIDELKEIVGENIFEQIKDDIRV